MQNSVCLILFLFLTAMPSSSTEAQAVAAVQHIEKMRAINSADIIISQMIQKIEFASNGEIKIRSQVTYKSQSEKGRVEIGIRELPYNATASTLKVLSASTINGTQRTPVSLSTVLVKSLSDSTVGLENYKKAIIPFNNVLANSSVEIDYEQTFQPTVPGIGEVSLQFDPQTPILNFEVTASSNSGFSSSAFGFAKSPNNPIGLQSIFSLLRTGPASSFTFTVKALTPIFTAFELQGKTLFEHGDIPVVYFSTAKKWSDIASKFAEKYEPLSSSPLPPEFQKIQKLAMAEKTDRMKLDRVHFELSKLIAYSGNWTTLERAFFPKGHPDVIKERKGDCKDFANSIVAIAKTLGFEANVALVNSANINDRTLRDLSLSALIPTTDYFNHAIAKVKGQDGRVYWIDGTRATPSSEVAWPEIVGSPALVISSSTTTIEKIESPIRTPDSNRFLIRNTVQTGNSAFPTWNGSLETNGNISPHILDQLKAMGPANIEKYLSLLLIGPSAKSEVPVKSASNILGEEFRDFQKFKFDFQAVGTSPVVVQGAEKSLSILSSSTNLFSGLYRAEKGSSIYVGAIGSYEFETKYEGAVATDEVRGDCLVRSEWIDFDRKIRTEPTATIVNERINIKSEIIRKNQTFNILHDVLLSDIAECFREDHLALTPLKLNEAQSKFHPDVKNFLLAPPLASQRKAAAAVLDKSYELENTYINMKAKRIFEEAIKENPKDLESHMLKFRTLRNLAMVNSATYKTGLVAMIDSEVTKLLETYPNEAHLYVNRALGMSLINRNAEALVEMKKAYSLKPNDFLVRRMMAEVLLNLNHTDVAEKWLKSAFALIKVKDSPVESNRNERFYWQTMIEITASQADPAANLEAHENFVRLNSDSPWAIHNYALALAQAKQLDKSIEQSRRALKIMNFGNGNKALATNLIAKALSFQKSPTDETYVLMPEVEKLMLEAKQVSPTDAYVNKAIAIFYRDKALATKESDWLDPADLYIAEGLKYNPDDSGLLAVDRDLDEYKRRLMEYFDQRKINPSGRWPASWKIKYGQKAGP